MESEEQAHLAVALHQVAERLGGLTRAWRFDRMSTVAAPGSGRVTATFAGLAKHYTVTVELCPPRRGNRKGVVEKANHAAAQRFWRSLPDTIDGGDGPKLITVEQAQARLDAWCAAKGDTRPRVILEPDGTHRRTTVGDLGAAEPLRPLPSPYPVTTTVERVVSAQALVSYSGNFYSVPPELARASVVVTVVHGEQHLSIAPAASPAAVVARHRLVAAGTGATIREPHHVSALNTAVMAAASSETGLRHRHKRRVPPGAAAVTAEQTLRRNNTSTDQIQHVPGQMALVDETSRAADVTAEVIDLERYAAIAAGRNTLR